MNQKIFPFLLLFFLFAGNESGYGQKKSISIDDLGNWPTVGAVSVSPNGEYVILYIYKLTNQKPTDRLLELKSLTNNWNLQIPNVKGGAQILSDSKHAIVPLKNDSLLVVQMGSDSFQRIPGVYSYKIMGNCLAYLQRTDSNSLKLFDFYTNKLTAYTGTAEYQFMKNRDALLLTTKLALDSCALQWVNLNDGSIKTFWKGSKPSSLMFDPISNRLAFIVSGTEGDEIWCYNQGDERAHKLLLHSTETGAVKKQSYRLQRFSQDGHKLFITVTEPVVNGIGEIEANVFQIWNSMSSKLRSQQLAEGLRPETYLAAIELSNGNIVKLQTNLEEIVAANDRWVLLARRKGDADQMERTWNPALKKRMYIVSVSNGQEKPIPFENGPALLSPEGKYVLYYNAKKRNYFTYEPNTGAFTNITSKINTTWTVSGNDNVDSADAVPISAIRWLKGDSGILINDRYDIWLLDPLALAKPINVTNGFGKKKGIHFYIIANPVQKVIDNTQKLLLSGFNSATKENGFFSKMIRHNGDPTQLTMGSCLYYVPFEDIADNGMLPLKADSAELYIVKRMDSNKSPNYFFTKDFISFTPVSDLYPESKYNWLKSELVNWNGPDQIPLQGIFYRPENFNPAKKYPLIIYCYEKLSNNLHLYESPQPSTGALNIPFMVSNGYLVFTPDIRYKVGNPGYSVLNSVVSAVKVLSKFSYIDGKRIGVQGHSFGGYETNFIVTHCNLFAAACSSAGPSDLISHYGSLNGAGTSLQGAYEIGQYRMHVNLWENTKEYLSNSPIMSADKVSTPILLNNNKEDDVVPFTQGVEFFTALRRLNKKAWLLIYEKEGHIITNQKVATDYTIKMKQFFDHFLMKTLMPDWMAKE